MQGNDGLLALFAGEEGHVCLVILEEVLGEDGCALGADEDVESRLLVWVAVCGVLAEGLLVAAIQAFLFTLLHLGGVAC